MQIEQLNEPVAVRADFQNGQIIPRAFKREGQTYPIRRIHAQWKERDGAFPRYGFSIEAEGGIYELALRTQDMTWRLERVILEG